MTTEPVRVMPVAIYADDPISRSGVQSLLRQQLDIELVETVAGHDQAVAVLVTETLDEQTVLLLRRLMRIEGARLVLVTTSIREAEVLKVIECGVSAIVWRREATDRRLHQAVMAAYRGEGDLPGDLLGWLISRMGTMQRTTMGAPDVAVHGLAPREIDVIRFLADGMDTGEIAKKLSYSERTVKNVIHGVATRLHLRNRAHAVAYALREGYI